MHIKRNEHGEIIAISRVAETGFTESIREDTEEIKKFFDSLNPLRQKNLAETDLDMARVLEDLVGLLIERDVIRFTDLPAAAQTKLLSRRELRKPSQGMDLLDDDEDLNI